jgi:hypothetical protein
MPTYTVWFNVPASVAVRVQSEHELPVDQYGDVVAAAEVEPVVEKLIDEASSEVYVGLCHSCASRVELGDPDPYYEDGRIVGITKASG